MSTSYRDQLKQTVTALENVMACFYDNEANELHRDAIKRAIREYEIQIERDEKDAALQAIGESAARCLSDMVAALEVDYDRLEELRTLKREAITPSDHDAYDSVELSELEQAAGDCTSREDAEQRIQEDPLSLQVRSGWYSLGETDTTPEEFEILLSTGGPATRIVGELDEHGQPTRARLQAQDWFTVWTDYRDDAISQAQLLAYCNVFYFGE